MQAAEATSTQSVRFELGPIEMEFQVVVKREGGGEAKMGFHILVADVTLSGSGKVVSEATQKVKFVLNPVLVDMKGQRTKLEISRNNDPGAAPDHDQPSKHTLGR